MHESIKVSENQLISIDFLSSGEQYYKIRYALKYVVYYFFLFKFMQM